MRIALGQINTIVGDLNGNLQKISKCLLRSKEMETDIVVFPELAITGYPPEDLLLKKHFIKDNLRALNDLVPFCDGITAIVGFVYQDSKSKIYNAAAVIHRKKIIGVYLKNNLPNYGVFDEQRYFVPGKGFKVFLYCGVPFSVNICEDIWLARGPCDLQAQAGAKIFFNLSASPYHHLKARQREQVLSDCAKRNRAFIAYCNLVGGQDELVFDGSSVVVDPHGRVLARAKSFQEDLLICDMPCSKKSLVNKRKNSWISLANRSCAIKKESIPERKEKKLSSVEEIYQALTLGTRDYVQKNGFSQVVLGLSGGIDSAVVACIARDALGKEKVCGVSMPSIYSSRGTQRDARLLAKRLGIHYEELSIDKIFNEYLACLSKVFKGTSQGLAEENLQARIRGNLLMAFSNKFGHLVLTTGNKSELSVGYCTLYGDMAGGYAVLKDVPKTTVYALADLVNVKSSRKMIPQSIIRRAPTAELKKNQKDQDTLPPYEFLDSILASYIEKDYSIKDLIQKNNQDHLVKKIVLLVDRMEYKRRQSPPGVKISPKAFGKDRRLPITNWYREA